MTDSKQRGVVEVLLPSRTKIPIVADDIIGAYAVHRPVWGGAAVGDGWSVTHRAFGIAMWTVKEYADALKVAQWLDQNKTIPQDEEGMSLWVTRLTPVDRSRLDGKLTALAPRLQRIT